MKTSTFTEPPSTAHNGDTVSQATSRAAEFGQRAADAIDDKRDAVARGIDSTASTLREQADRLPGGERVVSAAHSAADAMDTAADYVRDNDLQGILADIRQIARERPGATLLTAAALGFLLARTLSRN